MLIIRESMEIALFPIRGPFIDKNRISSIISRLIYQAPDFYAEYPGSFIKMR
jgi:hypothetical protein